MKEYMIYLIFFLLLLSCKTSEYIEKEPWIEKPISEWPEFVMTNDIEFTDTSYKGIANSFLINTGYDTLAVTCKHFFLIFRDKELNTINLGMEFIDWKMYPKGQSNKMIKIKNLINQNDNEQIGEYNTLKNRDWIIFNIDKADIKTYPLKIRTTLVKKGEIIFNIGWANQQTTKYPSIIKLQQIKNMGNYYYVKSITENVNPIGRSGSPVIDKNGYLIGIASGGEGNFGVIGSVNYLIELFEKYNVKYQYD